MINDRCFLPVLLFLFLAASPGRGQESVKPSTNDQLIAMAREIMASARYAALITSESNGRVYVRTVDPFPPEENMSIWFSTNPLTRKVGQIRRNPRVTLYYVDRDSQSYVAISGRARLVNDPQEKAKRWKDEWKAFYPDRGKSYLLIEVTPEKMELANVTKGVLGDPQTWKPPSVTFVRTKRAKR